MSADRPVTFVIEPSPDHPGWLTCDITVPDGYNVAVLGPLLTRREDNGTCRLRCVPRPHLRNALNMIHGGGLLGLIDVSLFAGISVLTEHDGAGAMTVDLSTQFIGAGRMDRPLDAVVEILRETGRLVFLRGVLEQEGVLVAAYHGTVRKASTRA